MKYMGSKRRIAKYILPIMLEEFKKNNCEIFIDATVGGGNLLDKVPKEIERIGIDNNEYLIEMWKAVSKGWYPPEIITEEEYNYIKNNKDEDKVLTGYVGFALSYGGKWFGGWCRDKLNKRNYVDEAFRNAKEQFPRFHGVEFKCTDLLKFEPEKKALIYCDPPYKGTTKYKDKFNYESFYIWCRKMKELGNIVFISEYEMPKDFKIVYQKELNSSLTKNTGAKKGLEKLFKL